VARLFADPDADQQRRRQDDGQQLAEHIHKMVRKRERRRAVCKLAFGKITKPNTKYLK
jgi:hypothetical protein